MADDVVLTQADIDAMLAGNSGSSASAVEEKAAVSENQRPPKAMAVSKSEIVQLKTQAVQQAAPVPSSPPPQAPSKPGSRPKISQPISRAQKKRTASQPDETGILRATIMDLANRLTKVEMALWEAKRGKNPSMNQMFHCESCDSQGMVAYSTKCTKCGKQTWWGWWPKNNPGNNNSNR